MNRVRETCMNVHYNNARSLSFFLVSTTNTSSTTVQPLARTNNNVRQPAIVQRQYQSPPTSAPPPPSSTINSTPYRETRPTTAAMITAIELTRYENL
jgi:hypothetical protein